MQQKPGAFWHPDAQVAASCPGWRCCLSHPIPEVPMFPSIDELMKAQAEAFKTTNSVATTAFDGARKLLELNVQAARAGMEESSAQLKALLAARDVSALNTLLADLFSQFSRPEGNKAAAYVKDVYDIAQQTHSQVAELIEKQVASSQQQLLAAVDALAKNAPAGSEGAVKLLRQSVVEANTAFEKVQAASRQVLDLIDANVNNLAKKGEAAAKKK
ncbi:MAG: phasin family protein [Lautropia sp.]|nr:MAG: phasin family protein [Lautropia sp.]